MGILRDIGDAAVKAVACRHANVTKVGGLGWTETVRCDKCGDLKTRKTRTMKGEQQAPLKPKRK